MRLCALSLASTSAPPQSARQQPLHREQSLFLDAGSDRFLPGYAPHHLVLFEQPLAHRDFHRASYAVPCTHETDWPSRSRLPLSWATPRLQQHQGVLLHEPTCPIPYTGFLHHRHTLAPGVALSSISSLSSLHGLSRRHLHFFHCES